MRRPLVPLNPELAAKVRQGVGPRGVDENNLPLSLTDAEKQAAANPGLADPHWKETHMETKPGIKSTEFWLKLLTGLAIAVLGYVNVTVLPAIAEKLPELGVVGVVLVAAVPLASSGVAWVLHKLSESYSDNRTELKLPAEK